MEEIDLFLAMDDSMPPGIENDDYDSEEDIRFLEELLSIDPLPLPKIKSSNLDYFNDPSSPRPPPEPPDVEVFFDFEGISEHYVLMPNILHTLPTLDPDFDFTPSHIFIEGEITSNFYKIPMMISGGDIPLLDVLIPQDHEDPCLFSIIQSLGLQSSAYYGILNHDH
ncbi:hypothetical protein Tco_0022630, partial [Tanacetum coccineum]